MKFALLFLLHMLVPVVGAVLMAAGMRWLGVGADNALAVGFIAFMALGIASAVTAGDRSDQR